MASKILDFNTAFRFPFSKASRLWNILWLLLPIFGWFAIIGYQFRIMKGFTDGKFKQLPKMTFKKDMFFGFWMTLKMIPYFLAALVIITVLYAADPTIGVLSEVFIWLIVTPVLIFHFLRKQTVDSMFEIKLVKHVFDNFLDYLVALLKDIALTVIFTIMFIVLVGIPAAAFTKSPFLADWYRRNVLKK